MTSQSGGRNSTVGNSNFDQRFQRTDLVTHVYGTPPNTSCSYDITTPPTSRLNNEQTTCSCDYFKYPHWLPQNDDSEHAASVSSLRKIEYKKTKRVPSIPEFVCRSPHCCKYHATAHRKPLVRYCNKYMSRYPVLKPSVGNINVTEKNDCSNEAQVSSRSKLNDVPSSRKDKNVTKLTWSVTFETWFGVGVLFCFMFIGFVHLHLRIRELEEQNIQLKLLRSTVDIVGGQKTELKQFKSNVNTQQDQKTEVEHFRNNMNMLEQLFKGWKEDHSKQRSQTTKDSPMSVTLPGDFQPLPVFKGTTIRPALQGGGLSRVKRDTMKQANNPVQGLMKSVIDDYCRTKSVNGDCKQNEINLDFVVFHAVFNQSLVTQHMTNKFKDPKEDPNSVSIDGEWPVIINVGHVITYLLVGTPLNIYQTYIHQTANSSSVLVKNSDDFKSFIIRTTGLYMVHVNITILDQEDKNINEHYLGLYLNDRAVMVCLGFRCSENLPDSNKIRICSMNGIFHLNDFDQIQLKTMKANTTIRIEKRSNSEITFVLLHKTKTP